MAIKSEQLDKPLGISLAVVFSVMAAMIVLQLWRLGLKDPTGSTILLSSLAVVVGGGGMIVKMTMK